MTASTAAADDDPATGNAGGPGLSLAAQRQALRQGRRRPDLRQPRRLALGRRRQRHAGSAPATARPTASTAARATTARSSTRRTSSSTRPPRTPTGRARACSAPSPVRARATQARKHRRNSARRDASHLWADQSSPAPLTHPTCAGPALVSRRGPGGRRGPAFAWPSCAPGPRGSLTRQMSLAPPPSVSTNPLRRLARTCSTSAPSTAVPARRHPPVGATHASLRTRPAATPARGLRAPRPGLHPADLPRQRRLRPRPRGQPPHPRLRRAALLLARRPHRRPDPAARRRAAHDRRRLPPALAHGSCCPSFHHERIAERTAIMEDETDRARGRLARRRDASTSTGGRASWRCASRCARCSGSTERRRGRPRATSRCAWASRARDYAVQVLRGPRTPWARMHAAPAGGSTPSSTREIDGAAPRPASAATDILSLLLDATDEDGHAPHRPPHPRRGHDAAVRGPRHHHLDDRVPVLRAGPQRRRDALETDGVRPERCWTRRCACTRRRGSDRAGRSTRSSSCGVTVPAGVPVNYCSWASHRLPDVWDEPEAFRPAALRPGQARADPQGRLRPVRRRVAHLHRDALRAGRDRRDRAAAMLSASARTGARLRAVVRQMPTITPRTGCR